MVFSDPTDAWKHLRNDTTFKTYADQRLAMLYLQNPDNFPVDMLIKVFDVVLDPLFKLEDITFKSAWDIFDYISEYRRRTTPTCTVNEIAHIAPQETHAYSVPPLVVSLVVDSMVEDRTSLGTLAEKDYWRDAYELDVESLHAMSLVHSTWTPIVRCALRRRVVVPYYQIDRFLLSPLCGPWIREAVVYWTIDNGLKGATETDVVLFEALLRRVPKLQSLVFVSSLGWCSDEGDEGEEHDAPPFRVSECLELIPNLVPNLENLWLGHFGVNTGPGSDMVYKPVRPGWCTAAPANSAAPDPDQCKETNTLSRQLPKLHLLKFLYMSAWGSLEYDDMLQHPSLETVQIYDQLKGWAIYGFRVPRVQSSLSALECDASTWGRLETPKFSSSLEKLRLHRFDSYNIETLGGCGSLEYLEVLTTYGFLSDPVVLPPSIKHLKITEYHPGLVCNLFSSHPFLSHIRILYDCISSLPRLRSLDISAFGHLELPLDYRFIPPEEEEGHTHPLIELCRGRGVECTVEVPGLFYRKYHAKSPRVNALSRKEIVEAVGEPSSLKTRLARLESLVDQLWEKRTSSELDHSRIENFLSSGVDFKLVL